jgi:molybdopterin/thiamine biosynthesis adenylyltransferase
VAAALGAAAVYHHFNRNLLPRYEDQAPLWISALHSSVTTGSIDDSAHSFAGPTLPSSIDLGKLLVVGAGALGGNALTILSQLKSLRGRIDVVDHDRLDLSNLNRLVAAVVAHLGMNKAELAASLFLGSAVDCFAHVKRYEQLAMAAGVHLPVEAYDLVVAGVDQMASRAFIQSGWPRFLIDGGTGGFSWRVSTFPVETVGACAGCLAGNAQGTYNQLRASMACAGGGVVESPQIQQQFESYGFVSFLCAAFLVSAVLQRSLGILPSASESISGEADTLYLRGLQRKTVQKSGLCLCRCGEPVVSDYRSIKYAGV